MQAASPSVPSAVQAPAGDEAAANRWPPQIKFIVGNEAAERFSYYGMRSILVLYITKVLGRTQDQATEIAHLFGFAVYFLPLLGAWVSDKFWGRYRTILWISLFYCVGHGVLALGDAMATISAKSTCLLVGLGVIAIGAGGIKPCVSAFVGDQFQPHQTRLMEKAFAAFYFSVNFGSFFSQNLIPEIHLRAGYGWAFGVPGILMALATFIFWLGTRHYVRKPPQRETKTAGFMEVFWYCLAHRSERAVGQKFWDVARSRFSINEVDGAASVGPVLSIFAVIPVFWALFEQNSSTWVLQGVGMAPFTVLGWEFTAEKMQSMNPLLVMLLVPLFTLGVYPLLGRIATPLRKIGIGMFLASLSYVVVAIIQTRIDAHASQGLPKLTLAWQILPYVILTTAEVLISVTGLEFAFTQAAPQMKSTIMSFWLLTNGVGQLLIALVTRWGAGVGGAAAVSPGRFYFYALMTAVVGVVFVLIAVRYRYRNPEGKPVPTVS